MKHTIDKKVKAFYIGPETRALNSTELYELTVTTKGASPGVEVITTWGKLSIGYPSKKKYLEHWKEEEVQTAKIRPMNSQNKKETGISIADAGVVIYTELVAAINRFNAKSVETYKEEPVKTPEFIIKLQQQPYDLETQNKTRLYGSAVLIIELKQFGLRRIVFQDGVSFHTEKELMNVNAYAPKLYINALNAFVESALMYILALNPDNIENVNALKETNGTEEEKVEASTSTS